MFATVLTTITTIWRPGFSGSHSDMHTKLEDISHDIYQKAQQNKTPNRTLTVDIESTMKPFIPTTFISKTLSRKLNFCLLTLMNFNVLEFKADLKNRIFYAVNIMC